MNTALKLYAASPLRVTNDLSFICGSYFGDGTNHLPEAISDPAIIPQDFASEKVETRFLAERYSSGRNWVLATVWFEGYPVMIVQNAGRSGRDHEKRFITAPEIFKALCEHIVSLLPINDPPKADVISFNDDMGTSLTHFYGRSLEDTYFNP